MDNPADIPWVPLDLRPAPTPKVTPTPDIAPPAVTGVPSPTAPPVVPAPSPEPQAVKKPKDDASARFLEKLTPEQHQRLKENLERWNKLPKAQQEELRRGEKLRKERILKEIKNAIQQSGLKLNEAQRQLFVFRYDQERRIIEEKLREEMDAKRKMAVAELSKQLAIEFQAAPQAPAPTPAQPEAATPKP